MNKVLDTFEQIFQSNPDDVDIVVKILEKLCEKHKFNNDIMGTCMICITEAFNNAVKHGNKLNSSKNVHLKIVITESEIITTVVDQGEGFIEEQVADPLADENILNSSGRGVHIIKQMMDNVKIISSPSGTTIKLSKKYI